VDRKPGRGTFVAPPKIHYNKLTSFSEQMATRSLSARSKVLSCVLVNKEPEMAARLALPADSPLVKLERVRFGAEEPFYLETSYLPAPEFAGLTEAPPRQGSLFATLERSYGLELAYSDEEVDATAADPRTARLLAIPIGQALLRIRQVIYSTKGSPVMHVLGLYRSDRVNLLIRRYR
jgi:GntR family transcriptional regulator